MSVERVDIGKTVKYLRAPLDRAHVFRGANGRDLACTLTRVTVYHDGRRAAAVEVDARFDHAVYQSAVEHGDFELSADNHGPSLGGALAADRAVDVTLFLRHALLSTRFSTVAAFGDETNRALDAMASPDGALAHTDAWIFVSVMQDVPGRGFQVGFKHAAYQAQDSHLLL